MTRRRCGEPGHWAQDYRVPDGEEKEMNYIQKDNNGELPQDLNDT